MSQPRVLIPVALGTNRDGDLARAFELAGALADRVPLTALRSGERTLADYQLLAIPGGFSYGDALGAGRLFGLDLAGWFGDQLRSAAEAGMPMFGVCNGFQALVRAGLLPGGEQAGVLTDNASDQFECRWVELEPTNASVWTADLPGAIRCPVAHGEGRFVAANPDAVADQVAFRYVGEAVGAAGYPANPNGSAGDIAGITDPTGRILGLMPHPENHVLPRQDPLRGRRTSGLCLPLFQAGVAAVASS